MWATSELRPLPQSHLKYYFLLSRLFLYMAFPMGFIPIWETRKIDCPNQNTHTKRRRRRRKNDNNNQEKKNVTVYLPISSTEYFHLFNDYYYYFYFFFTSVYFLDSWELLIWALRSGPPFYLGSMSIYHCKFIVNSLLRVCLCVIFLSIFSVSISGMNKALDLEGTTLLSIQKWWNWLSFIESGL